MILFAFFIFILKLFEELKSESIPVLLRVQYDTITQRPGTTWQLLIPTSHIAEPYLGPD